MADSTIPKPRTLPIIHLGRETVLLPGIVLRIPVTARPDILAPFSEAHDRSAAITKKRKPDIAPILVACVPLKSKLLSDDGQHLIEDASTKDVHGTDEVPASVGGISRRDLFGYGTCAKVTPMHSGPGSNALVVEGLYRIKLNKVHQQQNYLEAHVSYQDEKASDTPEQAIQDLFTRLKVLSRELLTLVRLSALLPTSPATNLSPTFARRLEQYITAREVDEAGALADFMANLAETTFEEKLRVLVAWDTKTRLERVTEALARQLANVKTTIKITSFHDSDSPTSAALDSLNSKQREAISRRMRGLPSGDRPSTLGRPGRGQDGEPSEVDELRQKIKEAKLSAEAEKVAQRELKRLEKMMPSQAEYSVIRNYLETLAEIPWSKMTEDQLGPDTLTRARKQLDDDHYGLEKVKKRLLEYLAVLKLKQGISAELEAQETKKEKEVKTAESEKDDDLEDESSAEDEDTSTTSVHILKNPRTVDKPPILLLVGPPGTGKTSLAKSVASSLGRKFHRISLGGVRDEAEIRGHRRTYVAAMPGLIINGLKKLGVNNPVFLLDEIDKVGGSNFHGDPSAAMLEVLDPEQNHTFVDHYVNIPFDLSKVLFIATANSLDTIPPPLLDRMETISLPGYTTLEKRHIAAQHLLPKQIATNGLQADNIILPTPVLDKVITSYTRESGVRNLERELGSVCRAKAVQYADAKDSASLSSYTALITLADLDAILGIEKYVEEITDTVARPGVVTGLVAYASGGQGSILFIEVVDMPGSGRVQLTGKLGDVLKESVEVALTWVKAHAFELGLTPDPSTDIMHKRSLHVHCPAGAIPKDGPSAGLAHTIALISLFAQKPVPPTLAMTGEVSLRGKVTPVGGIKEKLIGALGAGVKTVLLPVGNRKDVRDVPEEVKKGVEIVHVGHIWEAMRHVWPDAHWPGEEHGAGFESRL
ncbi:MAG: hypothetical protein M1817_005437 [Caeruleum heppii]|nr:MAG: hypothetical protein M1817_005437 [Caeruleum heppii]